MSKINKIPDFLKMAEELKRSLIQHAEKEGVTFFKNSFENEGFTDAGFEKWEKRRDTLPHKILQLSGTLKESIRVVNSSDEQITFAAEGEYAELHNEGGRVYIPITDKSRKFFWYMFKETGLVRWKWMALTKNQQFSFIMPQRKYIGESITFMNALDAEFARLISTGFKQL